MERKVTLSGKPADPNYADPNMGAAPAPQPIEPKTGMHGDYWILSEEERAKGFIRPVRRSYIHETCGSKTTMNQKIAETYAREPGFYGATFCVNCGGHYPVGAAGQFVWDDAPNEKVGT